MSVFGLYFNLGLQHIADLKGYDHILFILTRCAVYRGRECKRVLSLLSGAGLGISLVLMIERFPFG